MNKVDYWIECTETALEEAGITATEAQIKTIADCFQGGLENYDMAFPSGAPDLPKESELDKVRAKLKREREKLHYRLWVISGRQ